MKTFKLIVLLLLTIAFILYGMGFMMYSGITNTLLNKQYYRFVVDDYKIAASLHNELGTMIVPMVQEGVTGGVAVTDPEKKAAVDAQVRLISTAITDALDKDWLEEQVVIVTDDMVDLVSGENSSLSVALELKEKFKEIERNIATGLEKLSDAELFALFGAPRAYVPAIAEKITASLGLPESLVLTDLDQKTIDTVTGYSKILDAVFGLLAWVIILVFLVICILSWKVSNGLLWFGVSTALTGGLFLAFISFFSNLSTIENLTGVSFESVPIDSSTIQNIISFTFSEMKFMPILFLVGGIVVFFLGVVLRKAFNKAA